jgi:hypothetical protein
MGVVCSNEKEKIEGIKDTKENKKHIMNDINKSFIQNYEFYKKTKYSNLELIVAMESDEVFKSVRDKLKIYSAKWVEILNMSRKQRRSSTNTLLQTVGTAEIISTSEDTEGKYVGSSVFIETFIERLRLGMSFNEYRFKKYLAKGPPNRIRWAVWLSIAVNSIKFSSKETYEELITTEIDLETRMQIEKDLNRSCPNVKFFDTSEGRQSLFNVLKSIAVLDRELSYCQGINILVANMLLVADGNELETFHVIKYLFYHLNLRDFFMNDFPKLNMYIFIIKSILKEMFPKIDKIINDINTPDELWVFKWVQTLFTLSLPFSIVIRIWDCIFADGLDFLVNFSIAYIKHCEKQIYRATDIGDFMDALKIIPDFISENGILNLREKLIKSARNLQLQSQIEKFRNLFYIKTNYFEPTKSSVLKKHTNYTTPCKINSASTGITNDFISKNVKKRTVSHICKFNINDSVSSEGMSEEFSIHSISNFRERDLESPDNKNKIHNYNIGRHRSDNNLSSQFRNLQNEINNFNNTEFENYFENFEVSEIHIVEDMEDLNIDISNEYNSIREMNNINDLDKHQIEVGSIIIKKRNQYTK